MFENILSLFRLLLLLSLVVCAIATALSKRVMTAIILFTSYSIVMAVVWLLLRSPDLAITEAAVGAGVTSTLFFITLKNVGKLHEEGEEDDEYAE
ncbi:MAG: DUF4040 domain-containing protein [Oscillospiraceae bacterium]|nr:DUF4040 domain-containing protein [Oscillospiraceae bacterium]